MIIRPARLDDDMGIGAVYRSNTQTAGRSDVGALSDYDAFLLGGDWLVEDLSRVHIQDVLDRGDRILVAEAPVTGTVGVVELVGGVEPPPYGRNLHINSLAVLRGHHRQGIGRALVRWTLHMAEQEKFDSVSVVCEPDVAAFYDKMGVSRVVDCREVTIPAAVYDIEYDADRTPGSRPERISGVRLVIGRYQSSAVDWERPREWTKYGDRFPQLANAGTFVCDLRFGHHRAFCNMSSVSGRDAEASLWSNCEDVVFLTKMLLTEMARKGVEMARLLVSDREFDIIRVAFPVATARRHPQEFRYCTVS